MREDKPIVNRDVFTARMVGLVVGAAMFSLALSAGAEPPPNRATAPSSVETAEFSLSIGPLAASRSMEFEGDLRAVEHQPGLYLGVLVDADWRLTHFDSLQADLVAEGEFAYGVTRNRNFTPTSGPAPVTETTFGGGRLKIRRHLSSSFSLGVGLGAQATSFILEANPVYTGHRYIAADIHTELRWQPDTALWLGLNASALPVVAINHSSGAYGPGRAFGLRSGGRIGWSPLAASAHSLRDLELLLRYDYQRFRAQFPVASVGSRGGISVDTQHLFSLMIGVEF